jgi:hypothetical protein
LGGAPMLVEERKSPGTLTPERTSAKPPPREKRSLAGGPSSRGGPTPASDRFRPPRCRFWPLLRPWDSPANKTLQ